MLLTTWLPSRDIRKIGHGSGDSKSKTPPESISQNADKVTFGEKCRVEHGQTKESAIKANPPMKEDSNNLTS